MKAIITANTHATGTGRVAEVGDKIPADCYINVQGDEPIIEPQNNKGEAMLKIIDVTLRDGSCVNDFNFEQHNMEKILAVLHGL
ncbi:MAG: hypothetical protein FWG64_06980 [Firmicutes bacterium]|nr:hypothetical protein [Bacillota bacterium]